MGDPGGWYDTWSSNRESPGRWAWLCCCACIICIIWSMRYWRSGAPLEPEAAVARRIRETLFGEEIWDVHFDALRWEKP